MTDSMTALKIAANTDDPEKIREHVPLPREPGDAPLERAMRSRAAALGILAAPGKSGALANRIETTYNDLLARQHAKVHSYAAAVKSGKITPDYVLEQTNYSQFMTDIDALTGDATRNRDAAQAAYEAEYTKLATISSSTNPSQALLDETRATKIWSRIERKLNTTGDHLSLLSNAITTAAVAGDEKRLTLAVILTEAPQYLDAQGVPNAEDAIRQVALDASPALLAAQEQVVISEKVLGVARHNANVIRNTTANNPLDMPKSTDKVYGYAPFSSATKDA